MNHKEIKIRWTEDCIRESIAVVAYTKIDTPMKCQRCMGNFDTVYIRTIVDYDYAQEKENRELCEKTAKIMLERVLAGQDNIAHECLTAEERAERLKNDPDCIREENEP